MNWFMITITTCWFENLINRLEKFGIDKCSWWTTHAETCIFGVDIKYNNISPTTCNKQTLLII